MKWIEIGFGLVLVVIAHVGAVFFGFDFKLYLALVVVALFIGSHVLLQWYYRRIARQLLDLSADEINNVLAPLDATERQKVLARLEKEKARTKGLSEYPISNKE